MDTFDSIVNTINKLGDLKSEISNILQGEVFDSIAYSKSEQLASKARAFVPGGAVYLAGDLGNTRPLAKARNYVFLNPKEHNWATFEMPQGSILLLTNNDIGAIRKVTHPNIFRSMAGACRWGLMRGQKMNRSFGWLCWSQGHEGNEGRRR